jgi:lipopolysaccharide heptosyltransferase I
MLEGHAVRYPIIPATIYGIDPIYHAARRFRKITFELITFQLVRILIVKLGSIGDIVHTLPALAAIRRSMPEAHLSWAAERRSAEILRGNPMIDRLVEIDPRQLRGVSVDEMLRELRGQVGELRQGKYDISLDFQGLIKSAVVAKLSGAKKRWGFSRRGLREPASRILLTDVARIPDETHVVRKNLLLANAAVGADIAGPLEFPIAVSQADAEEAASVAARAGARFAILNPGGGWVTKLWDAANYGRLADLIWERRAMTSVIVTGPEENALAEAAMAASRTGKAIAAHLSLKGFYALARRAAVYVGGDTGPTHIAVAAGAPVVGTFGPTEWWRNGSINPDDMCVERNDIGCRENCHRRTCSNWICMDISVDRVFDAVAARVSSASLPIINA